jgi:hypothetical protein
MSFDFFLLLTVLTGLIALGAMFFAYYRSQDSFHPLIYLGLLQFALYCYYPLNLYFQDAFMLAAYLPLQHLEYVQTINLLGVTSLCAGVLSGDKGVRFFKNSGLRFTLPHIVEQRINQAAILCGFLGVFAFAFSIINVGGLEAAYGQSYGGGWDESGYIREAPILTVPALLWLMTTHIRRKLSQFEWGLIFLFATPFLMHGLLGARRGPTAMVLISLVIGWYLMRFRRPPLSVVITGSVILGFLMLFLVANRNNIYLGSEFNLQTTQSYATDVGSSNEYIYGGGLIYNTDAKGNYFWGRRYFTIFFIRPIPRAMWPTKYEDASKMLGIPDLETNLGTDLESFYETVGWAAPPGSAPGIIADMWVEFWWSYLPVLFMIGWLYGMAWRNALTRGGVWIPVYTLMTSLSVYLVMQTLEAMAFRLLLTVGACWLIWRYGISGLNNQANSYPENLQDRNNWN